MADHSMSFQDTLAQLGGKDFLRDLTEFMLNRIMEGDVAQCINADRHERTDERETYRKAFVTASSTLAWGRWTFASPSCSKGRIFHPSWKPADCQRKRSMPLSRRLG